MNKQKSNTVGTNSKDNIAPASHGDALRAFYARMASTNGPDHPWMLEFAGIIATHEDSDPNDAILSGVDKIDLSIEIMDDLLKLAFDKCAATDNMGAAQSAIVAARRYACDIREQTAVIANGAFA
jgi:hypothetical protein